MYIRCVQIELTKEHEQPELNLKSNLIVIIYAVKFYRNSRQLIIYNTVGCNGIVIQRLLLAIARLTSG